MRLWKATVSYDVYVVADTLAEASGVAADHVSDELSALSARDVVDDIHEVASASQVDPTWLDALPYRDGAGNETCREIIARVAAGRRPGDLPGQGELFGEGESP